MSGMTLEMASSTETSLHSFAIFFTISRARGFLRQRRRFRGRDRDAAGTQIRWGQTLLRETWATNHHCRHATHNRLTGFPLARSRGSHLTRHSAIRSRQSCKRYGRV
jgi:hypothetical protein